MVLRVRTILAKCTRKVIRSELLLECRYYSGEAHSHDSFLHVSFLRAIVPRIFIADQRIQGISFALDLLRDTEAAHTVAFYAPGAE